MCQPASKVNNKDIHSEDTLTNHVVNTTSNCVNPTFNPYIVPTAHDFHFNVDPGVVSIMPDYHVIDSSPGVVSIIPDYQ